MDTEHITPSVFCAHTDMVEVAALVENPRNPNRHPENQIEALAKIIKHQGWRNPIVVSKRSGFIVKGHGRLKAAQMLKLEHVPVDYQDYENEAAEWADMVADNKIAELSQIDKDELSSVIAELEGSIDLELTGFDTSEIDELLEDTSRLDVEADEPVLGDTEGIDASDKFGVIVMCADEEEQKKAFNSLSAQGYECKVVCV